MLIQMLENKDVLQDASFLCNQYDNESASIAVNLPALFTNAEYNYFILCKAPNGAINQYSIPLVLSVDKLTFAVTSVISSIIGNWQFCIVIKSATGDLIALSAYWTGKVLSGIALQDQLAQQAEDANLKLLYDASLQAETLRVIAEDDRLLSEIDRKTSEVTRVANENLRLSAESSRISAENLRVPAESVRITNEDARKSAETIRLSNEVTRVNSENSRVSAESARGSAESTRISNEENRVTAESARLAKETERLNAETDRLSSETTRKSNETTRVSNESGRVTAESGRVTAESNRGIAETGRSNTELSRVAAETARANAETIRATFYDDFNAQLDTITTEVTQHKLDYTEQATFPITNLISNGDFSNGVTGWNFKTALNGGVIDNTISFTASSQFGGLNQGNIIADNKYYLKALVKSISNNVRLLIRGGVSVSHSGSGNFENLSIAGTPTASQSLGFAIEDFGAVFSPIYVKKVIAINLTATFGAGKEPTALEMDSMLAKFPNGWFNGTVNLRTLKEIYTELKVEQMEIATMTAITIAAADTDERIKRHCTYACTGISDQIVINNAIQSLPLTGGAIQLSSGNYSISAPILIDRGLDFRGHGQSTRITLANNSNAGMVAYKHMTNNKQQHSRFSDIILLGNSANNTGTKVIGFDLQALGSADQTRDLIVENVWIDDINGDAVGTTATIGMHHVYFNHCSFEHCKRHLVNFAIGAMEVTFMDCLLYSTLEKGIIFATAGGKLKITNCHFEEIAQYGLQISSLDGIVTKDAHVTVIGNKFVNCAYGTTPGVFNVVNINSKGGIYTGNSITGNVNKNAPLWGFAESGIADYNIISNNIIITNGTGGNLNTIGAHTINSNNITTL